MHSSRMRTAHSLPYSGRGGGISVQGGCLSRGGVCPGVPYRGVFDQESLSRGVSVQEGRLCPGGGVSVQEGGLCPGVGVFVQAL